MFVLAVLWSSDVC
jgi:peptidoglycan/LPS O-acetylase OafA/YrhL